MHLGDSRQNIGLAVGGGVMGVLPGTLSKDNTFKRDFRKKKIFFKCALQKARLECLLSLGKVD